MRTIFGSYLMKKIAGGVGFGIGLSIVVGMALVVIAVAPGVVTNPTFGPTDDDVSADFLSGPLQVSTELCPVGATFTSCTAICPAGTRVIAGGCDALSTRWYVNRSIPDLGFNGWNCEFGEDFGVSNFNQQGMAYAVCAN